MGVYTCNPSIQETKQEDREFKVNPDYLARPVSKKVKIKKKFRKFL
jgi:hypothetical protein